MATDDKKDPKPADPGNTDRPITSHPLGDVTRHDKPEAIWERRDNSVRVPASPPPKKEDD